jgi:NADPH2:quinone reductase
MKAIQLVQVGSTESLKYVDVACPAPEPSQVLVRVHAASVNFADVMIRKGVYPQMPLLPTILGLDCSGVVEAVGSEVTRVKSGQTVVAIGTGCYAECMVTEENWVFPIPGKVDREKAASLPVTYLTAYHLLNTMGQVKKGETVLVYAAAGGVGSAVGQLAKSKELTVIGLTSSDAKAKFAKDQGYDGVINSQTANVPEMVNNLTNGKGVNLILNSVAGETFGSDFQMLTSFGQIVWFGSAAGPPSQDVMEQWRGYLGKSGGIRFFSLTSLFDEQSNLLESSMRDLIKSLAEGSINPPIHETLPLCEAPKAHSLLETGSVMGKLLLKP